MAEYAVECVDRKSGNPYTIRVEAETHQRAVEKASLQHVVGKVHRIDFSPESAPPRPTIQQETLAAIREQNERLAAVERRLLLMSMYDQSFSNAAVKAAIWFATWAVLSAVIAALFGPAFLGMGG